MASDHLDHSAPDQEESQEEVDPQEDEVEVVHQGPGVQVDSRWIRSQSGSGVRVDQESEWIRSQTGSGVKLDWELNWIRS